MGLLSRQQKPPVTMSSTYSQHSTDDKNKLAGYESSCCWIPSPFCGRSNSRRREQMKRFVIYISVFIGFLVYMDHISLKMGEFDIKNGFDYPMNIHNFPEVVEEFRYKIPNLSHAPLNNQYSMIEFLHKAVNPKDGETLKAQGLLIVIKSAVNNVEKRDAIRNTWGGLQYLEDTKLAPDLPTKLVFICGLPADRDFDKLEDLFHDWKHNDIVVADFYDSYENNTFKSILALRWGREYPTDFQYLFLVDDDMYVDLVNLVNYLRNFPDRTFEKLVKDESQAPFYQMSTIYNKNRSLISGRSILQQGLYMGQVYWNAMPIRKSRIFGARKTEWVVPLDEYPYNYYPSYIPGAAMIFSKEAVHKMYYASLFVKPFKIDDVYLGIVSFKVGILPVQNQHFFAWYPEHFYKLEVQDFVESIAIHGLECTSDMVELWTNRNLSRIGNC